MIGVVAAVWFIHFRGAVVYRDPIIWSVAVIAVLTVISRYAVSKWEWLSGPLLFRIVDILLVSVVVYFSDGIQSPFYPLYYITVVACAVNFGTSGALVNAGLIAVISLGIEAIEAATGGPTPLYFHEVVRTVPYLFFVALIAGALRDRMNVVADAAADMKARQSAREAEMEVARAVQKAQLPRELPKIEGVETALFYKPAREVGGDFYDFYPVGQERLGITIADAAGKGVPAALMVSGAKYAVRENYGSDKNAMLQAVNHHLLSVTTEDTFVTLLYGELWVKQRQFKYANAGQMPPIVAHPDGRGATVYEHADLPLGVMCCPTYSEHTIYLEPGDILLLYSDGVTDALGDLGEGFRRLLSVLPDAGEADLNLRMDKLSAGMANARRVDDVTMVAVRIK